jgi:hypothetical protein
MANDLLPLQLDSLAWGKEDTMKSLQTMHHYVVKEMEDAIKWYFVKKNKKRVSGYLLRLGAIIFTALGGIIPILCELINKNPGETVLKPIWSAVAFAIAGLLLLLDRFGGHSSSWIRFVLTANKLKIILEEFRFNWEIWKSSNIEKPLSSKDISEALVKLKKPLIATLEVIDQETRQWAIEFRGILKEIDLIHKGTKE